jgi:capsular polysaccharide transport system permease protein
MTSKLKVVRYNIRRVERQAAPTAPEAGAGLFDNHEDGFGALDFRHPEPAFAKTEEAPAARTVPPAVDPAAQTSGLEASGTEDDAIAAANAAIAAEGLTGRQMRRARLIAQRHNITAASDFDAIRQLRAKGVDPFSRASILGLVETTQDTEPPQEVKPDMPQTDPIVAPESGASGSGAPERGTPERGAPKPGAPEPAVAVRPEGTAMVRLPGDSVQLPQRAKPINPPSVEKRAEVNQAAEIQRMQHELVRRRRRRLALLVARLFAFVLVPTFVAGWYFYMLATPMYSTRSEFVIQQAGPNSSGGNMGGLFSGTGLATSQDSIAVQGYLQSREAMSRLEADVGFRHHFQGPEIDTLQRLPADATLEAAYKKYKNFVKISYDSSEGVVRMDVAAADPEVSAEWSRQLISYAEEQVDHLTQRLRADQMKDAQDGYETAQKALSDSQRRLIELQEKFKILSSEAEIGLLTGQINALQTQLTQERLSLAEMEANPEPNQARMEPIKRRIATLEAEVADLRKRMTEGSESEVSLAEVQGEMLVAQADMQTRQLLLAQALQSMETSRVEANRQVRYLSLSVSPVPPDEPTFPRAFENTLVTMLIMLGIYLMISMTASILREQVST